MAYSDLDAIEKMLINCEAGGVLQRWIAMSLTGSTSGNITSGYIAGQRFPVTFTVPALTGYTGFLMNATAFSEDANQNFVIGLEYDLGSLAVSTNTFTAGTDASMPSKTTRSQGASYTEQTAAMCCYLVATTALTAATPVITITYVNQGGTGGRTATLTLPTNATINSAFDISPHLQSGDTAIQDVTGMSTSAGSAGVLKVKGVIPFALMNNNNGNYFAQVSLLQRQMPLILAESGEKVAFYKLGSSALGSEMTCHLTGVPI